MLSTIGRPIGLCPLVHFVKYVVKISLWLVDAAHREGDAAAVVIDAGDDDAHVLVDVYLTGGGETLLRHLRHMDEAVLVDAQVNEGAELGHVGDNAVQFHALAQVLDVVDVLVKFPDLHRRARVTPGFL